MTMIHTALVWYSGCIGVSTCVECEDLFNVVVKV